LVLLLLHLDYLRWAPRRLAGLSAFAALKAFEPSTVRATAEDLPNPRWMKMARPSGAAARALPVWADADHGKWINECRVS
jgi:hypothetical protein